MSTTIKKLLTLLNFLLTESADPSGELNSNHGRKNGKGEVWNREGLTSLLCLFNSLRLSAFSGHNLNNFFIKPLPRKLLKVIFCILNCVVLVKAY